MIEWIKMKEKKPSFHERILFFGYYENDFPEIHYGRACEEGCFPWDSSTRGVISFEQILWWSKTPFFLDAENEWINTKEQNPIHNEMILFVAYDYDGSRDIHYGYVDEYGFNASEYGYPIVYKVEDVLCWLPIPPIPKMMDVQDKLSV